MAELIRGGDDNWKNFKMRPEENGPLIYGLDENSPIPITTVTAQTSQFFDLFTYGALPVSSHAKDFLTKHTLTYLSRAHDGAQVAYTSSAESKLPLPIAALPLDAEAAGHIKGIFTIMGSQAREVGLPYEFTPPSNINQFKGLLRELQSVTNAIATGTIDLRDKKVRLLPAVQRTLGFFKTAVFATLDHQIGVKKETEEEMIKRLTADLANYDPTIIPQELTEQELLNRIFKDIPDVDLTTDVIHAEDKTEAVAPSEQEVIMQPETLYDVKLDIYTDYTVKKDFERRKIVNKLLDGIEQYDPSLSLYEQQQKNKREKKKKWAEDIMSTNSNIVTLTDEERERARRLLTWDTPEVEQKQPQQKKPDSQIDYSDYIPRGRQNSSMDVIHALRFIFEPIEDYDPEQSTRYVQLRKETQDRLEREYVQFMNLIKDIPIDLDTKDTQ